MIGILDEHVRRITIRAMASRLWPWAVLAALTLAVYFPVAGFSLLSLDDNQMITANPIVIRGLTKDGLNFAFSKTYTGTWMPLTWLSHMAAVSLFGVQPQGHHLVNLVLHIANTLLLFGFLRAATGARGPSLFTAVVFAIHPLHVESVAWVSERKDVLMVFFGLLALLAWLRWVRRGARRWYAAALALFACGLMAKALLVVLAPLLLVLDYWPLGSLYPGIAAKKRGAIRLLAAVSPFFLLAVAAGIKAMAAQKASGAMQLESEIVLFQKALHVFTAYLWYLRTSFWPAGLAVFYPYPIGGEPLGRAAAAALLLGGMTAGALLLLRRAPYLAVGWLWFLGALLPAIGLVQVGLQSYADRYSYFPLVGLALAVSWGATAVLRSRRILLPLALATATVLAVACSLQLGYWRNDETLARRALAVTQNNAMAHLGLGFTLRRQGRTEEAIFHFREGIRTGERSGRAASNLGAALLELCRYDEAAEACYLAIRIAPQERGAIRILAAALESLGRTLEARLAAHEAQQLQPRYANALNIAGLELAERGEFAEGERLLALALRLAPADPVLARNLAAVQASHARQGGRWGEPQGALNTGGGRTPTPGTGSSRAAGSLKGGP